MGIRIVHDEDVRIKYNEETDDVEFLDARGEVVDRVGPEVVESWVRAYNSKHGYVKPEVVETSTEVETGKEETKTEGTNDEQKESSES